MKGRVYLPQFDAAAPCGVGVSLEIVELQRLLTNDRLIGRHVEVRNGAMVPAPCSTGTPVAVPHARPNPSGDFLFNPGRGGARMDRSLISEARIRRYIETSHFSEVNAYFHLDRIGQYISELLVELGERPLPPVTVVVHAHNACAAVRQVDGVRRKGGWRPFQGGHYRLPGNDHDITEHSPVSATGEIHLGSGQRRLTTGALARRAGKSYRHNAGHNAGTIYHEYGHHVHRHTADFRANQLRPPHDQSNRKVSMDEGTCDYWAAVMLGTPHIWAWHRRHDDASVHRRSLVSARTMAQYNDSVDADPHANGTIWGAALWDFRQYLQKEAADERGGRLADKIVLLALAMIGRIQRGDRPATCRVRSRFRTGLNRLLEADQVITGGRWQDALLQVFGARGISTARRSEVGQ